MGWMRKGGAGAWVAHAVGLKVSVDNPRGAAREGIGGGPAWLARCVAPPPSSAWADGWLCCAALCLRACVLACLCACLLLHGGMPREPSVRADTPGALNAAPTLAQLIAAEAAAAAYTDLVRVCAHSPRARR